MSYSKPVSPSSLGQSPQGDRRCHSVGQLWPKQLLTLFLAFAGIQGLQAQSSNNTCSSATANRYPVNGHCVPLAFNKPTSYTATYNPGGCNASNHDDAWGSFIATGTLTTVQYTPTGATNAILHVLASCTGPVLGCADDAANNGTETVILETVPGTTYYVRVQRRNSNSAMNGSLCIFTSGDCMYRLNLYDSYSNGWGGYGGTAYVEVTVNGTVLGSYSLPTGTYGYVDLPFFEGDVVELTYHVNNHGNPQENSFSMTAGANADLCLFASSSPPPDGVPQQLTVNCQPTPLPALPQDCRGGNTVCSNQSITSNSTGIGCTMDLNATNRGCLLSGEMQGSWHYFSPSASGTLGLTITPHDPYDDYDFALWGPYDAAQCPNTDPARCSYFDGNGTYNNQTNTTTGMGNGANDTSEGAYAPPYTNNGWVKPMDVIAGKVYILYVDNWSVSGQAFDLDWNLTNGASLNCTTLPVELLALEAVPDRNVIHVEWTTATERGSHLFEVERSDGEGRFEAIGTVKAAGDMLFASHYRFTDTAPLHGANHYRLLQVDRDGGAEYSRSVVAFMHRGGPRPGLYPNPAEDLINLGFMAPRDGLATVRILDATGRTVQLHEEAVQRGSSSMRVPLHTMARGWYKVSVVLPDDTPMETVTFVKQ